MTTTSSPQPSVPITFDVASAHEAYFGAYLRRQAQGDRLHSFSLPVVADIQHPSLKQAVFMLRLRRTVAAVHLVIIPIFGGVLLASGFGGLKTLLAALLVSLTTSLPYSRWKGEVPTSFVVVDYRRRRLVVRNVDYDLAAAQISVETTIHGQFAVVARGIGSHGSPLGLFLEQPMAERHAQLLTQLLSPA